jgi:4-diphosphocytidyl-2-C-methyl-D-erythritol kinase
MVKLLAERAPAKINLFLRVTGRRPDGYHELDSIFVPISVQDRVRIEVRPARISRVALRCNLDALADARTNLAARAARAFLSRFALDAEVSIDLEKTIPAGAGLGGGSSDAGAVLRMMAALFRLDDRDRLRAVALELGADVPFFIDPRPSRVGGIGERATALERFPRLQLVIAVPPVEVPTAAIFKRLRPEAWSGPAPDKEVCAILRGEITQRYLANDLAAVATESYPEIARLKELIDDAGARASAMSGSGGAVFGIFADERRAAQAASMVASKAADARVFFATSL